MKATLTLFLRLLNKAMILINKTMEHDNFQKNLLKHTEDFRKVLATPSGDWSVKGFIDIAKTFTPFRLIQKLCQKSLS